MLFNSFEYALFLPIVFVLYWFVFNRNLRLSNLFLLAVSYLFYGWWDYRFLSLIILSSLVDFHVGKKLGTTNDIKTKKHLCLLSIIVNLGLLGFFKYYNFFITEFVDAFGLSTPEGFSSLNVILPVGISFYTFQTLSYSIDIYRNKIEPEADWVTFFAFVSFFPQLVAGPIERAANLVPQFRKIRVFNYHNAKDGMRQILWGLFKKIVIADSAGLLANDTFGNTELFGTAGLILGVFLFSVQIYCDFSGYSDIAIGTARLFGFDLMRNFAYPYFARDIGEFWRRWHISLSTWFRDYLYIPLGGSRVDSTFKYIRNIMAIFVISGLWHGANWTFIVWGFLHGLFFIPAALLQRNRRFIDIIPAKRLLPAFDDLLRILLTFSLVSFSWIFFRAENISHAGLYLQRIFTAPSLDLDFLKKSTILIAAIALTFSIEWLQRAKPHAFQFDGLRIPAFIRGSIYVATAMAILLLSPSSSSTFIYFQF